MGIVWEAYHKGVPLLGVPGITLDRFLCWHLAASTWYRRIRQDFGCWQVRISGRGNL